MRKGQKLRKRAVRGIGSGGGSEACKAARRGLV